MPDPQAPPRSALGRASGRYAQAFALPGSLAFSSSGWFGRFPKGSLAIGVLVLVADASGSYALGGAVSGTLTLALAAAGPLWSRVMDRWGQRRALALSLPVLVAASLGLVTAVLLGAPVWSWFALAIVAGAAVIDIGSAVRARWSAATSDPALRHTAYSVESVADEAAFVVAPPVVTLLASLVHPAAGVLVGLAIGLVGGVSLLVQVATQPPLASAPADRAQARVRLPLGLVGVVAVFASIGGVFGSFNVAAIATAEDAGAGAASGLLLSAYSIGSVLTGVVVGAARLPGSPRSRFVAAGVLFGVVVPVLLLAESLPILAVLAFVAGLATSPLLITGSSLVEAISPRRRLTEALAWPPTGLALGVTAGSTLGGLAVESAGTQSGFAVTASAAALGALLTAATALLLRRRPAAR
ncbi:Predicted arabinose efflux permease, MFS family [Rathayibacter oskolensis]|uniref:Predicted arabinose efflux permease, MFS family n=1 Tax=Rathayibacter oskolensis TaxID=1891671 RepID=A0A1X7PF47_9MICO|nr:MFS transporter [Rathayibacter oskolensis]SMH49822.1 Predicted arabinose efflux permease, MFS family [Rathayibacter oskolensis]